MCISFSSSLLKLVNEQCEWREDGEKKCAKLMNLALLEWFTDDALRRTNCKRIAFFVNQIVIECRTLALLLACIFVTFEKTMHSFVIIISCIFFLYFFHFRSKHFGLIRRKENERPITVCGVCVCRSWTWIFSVVRLFRIEKADDSYAKSFQMGDCKCSFVINESDAFYCRCLKRLL